MRKIFTFLFAALMSVGMMNAKVTWNSSNISDLSVMGASYSKEGVTLSGNSDMVYAYWQGYGDESHDGISFQVNEAGGFTFSNTLGTNFIKIEMTLNGPGGWDMANLGSGWNIDGDLWDVMKVIWTGNASTVDLLKEASDFGGATVKSIVFYFVGDSEEPAPTTYTLQLVADPEKGSVAVTNLLGSDIIDNGNGNYTVPENASVTILATPLEGFEFTGWKVGNIDEMVGCYYCGTALNTEDNPYTFTMTADVAYLAEFEAAAPQLQMDETAIYAAFPAENHPAEIEIAFINRDFTWGMEALDNKPWYASELDLMTSAEDTIKFRDKANNAKILCEFIPANGAQDGRWQQMYIKMANYEVVSFKGEMVRLIEELDLRDAAKYAWLENAPEPLPAGIENIVLTEKAKKVIMDGVVYIVRDGKIYNVQGVEVK